MRAVVVAVALVVLAMPMIAQEGLSGNNIEEALSRTDFSSGQQANIQVQHVTALEGPGGVLTDVRDGDNKPVVFAVDQAGRPVRMDSQGVHTGLEAILQSAQHHATAPSTASALVPQQKQNGTVVAVTALQAKTHTKTHAKAFAKVLAATGSDGLIALMPSIAAIIFLLLGCASGGVAAKTGDSCPDCCQNICSNLPCCKDDGNDDKVNCHTVAGGKCTSMINDATIKKGEQCSMQTVGTEKVERLGTQKCLPNGSAKTATAAGGAGGVFMCLGIVFWILTCAKCGDKCCNDGDCECCADFFCTPCCECCGCCGDDE